MGKMRSLAGNKWVTQLRGNTGEQEKLLTQTDRVAVILWGTAIPQMCLNLPAGFMKKESLKDRQENYCGVVFVSSIGLVFKDISNNLS